MRARDGIEDRAVVQDAVGILRGENRDEREHEASRVGVAAVDPAATGVGSILRASVPSMAPTRDRDDAQRSTTCGGLRIWTSRP
jgi:hypothetical protein